MIHPLRTHGCCLPWEVVRSFAVLANCWANNPSLQMTNPAKLNEGFFQFALTNDSVRNFSVEVTTNLLNWDFLGPTFPVYQFFDAESTN